MKGQMKPQVGLLYILFLRTTHQQHINTMRVVYLLLMFQVNKSHLAWLQCDRTTIHTTIGKDIDLLCKYNANMFLFSKKYWCFGESRNTCEVLMDTDGFKTARLKKNSGIYQTSFQTFQILMTDLQLEDAGIYWAGIDKLYADIMVSVEVVVTEEAVSRPRVWLDNSPGVTCQGQPVLLRCRTERGTNVKYSWSRESWSQDVLLQSSADLLLHCASVTEDARYICSARNAVSSEQSQIISLHLLQAGQENCIYFLMSDELESYDCMTTALPVITTVVEVSSSKFVTQTRSGENQSLGSNQTQNWNKNLSNRSWSGIPLWYDVVRWLFFVSLVTSVGLVRACTKSSKRATTTKLMMKSVASVHRYNSNII